MNHRKILPKNEFVRAFVNVVKKEETLKEETLKENTTIKNKNRKKRTVNCRVCLKKNITTKKCDHICLNCKTFGHSSENCLKRNEPINNFGKIHTEPEKKRKILPKKIKVTVLINNMDKK